MRPLAAFSAERNWNTPLMSGAISNIEKISSAEFLEKDR
jgi:hypothetical protein